MAAIALDLPGVTVTRMLPEAPPWHRWAIDLRETLMIGVVGRLVGFELARAGRIADPVRRAARYAAMRARFARSEAGATISMHTTLKGLDAERAIPRGPGTSWITHPEFRDDQVLLYVPGGSFVVQRSPHFTALVARVSRAAGIGALVCDYRLAPEHPCPAAVDDVEAAFNSLVARGHAPEAIVLIAESTGCGIALAAAQRLVAQRRGPAGLALLSPWIDCDPARRDIHPAARTCARLYLNGANPRDPANNPAYGLMRGLPPIAIHGNRRDPFFADAEMLARQAAEQGVRVELRHWPGKVHVLERFDDEDARRSVSEIAMFVHRCLPMRHAA